MNPASYNITIQKGADFSQRFRFKDSTGTAMNLTGHALYAEMWDKLKTEKLADFQVIWNNRSQGDFNLVLSSELTSQISRVGYWDILVVNPDNTQDYWVRGRAGLETGYTE